MPNNSDASDPSEEISETPTSFESASPIARPSEEGMIRVRVDDGVMRIDTPVSTPSNPTTFDPPGKVVRALALLLDADELEETRKIFEREQSYLLTDCAELVLATQIQKEREFGRHLRGDYLLFYHTLIHTARQFGSVEMGWKIGGTAIRITEARKQAKVTHISEVASITQEEAKQVARGFMLLAEQLELEFS
jgi:hypothetical protein